jgi:hypothetical protein
MSIPLFAIAIVWAYMYNSFFGWNFSSKSTEEVICDGIFAILLALSVKG